MYLRGATHTSYSVPATRCPFATLSGALPSVGTSFCGPPFFSNTSSSTNDVQNSRQKLPPKSGACKLLHESASVKNIRRLRSSSFCSALLPSTTGGALSSCFLGWQLPGFSSRSDTLRQRKSQLKRSNRGEAEARIKRRKDVELDRVIEVNKKVKMVTRVKEVLMKQPQRMMSLKDLGPYRKYIGILGRRRIIVILRRYPTIFQIFRDDMGQWVFRFTKEAELQCEREALLQKSLEELLVNKLRKLLMMSLEKRIAIQKLTHLKRDLGLPEDWDTTLVHQYPQYFRVVDSLGGLMLELTSWDPALAVTAQEAKRLAMREASEADRAAAVRMGAAEEEKGSGRGASEDGGALTQSERSPARVRSQRLPLPKGYNLTRKDVATIRTFLSMPFVSPYVDASDMVASSPQAEKRAVAVVHEMLSLTLEKRILVDHLTHFRKDFKFSQRLHGMLIRHPEVFYVSFKGTRDSVFLREAYDGDTLIYRDPLLVVREKLAELVVRGRQAERLGTEDDVADDDSEAEDEDDKDDFDDEEIGPDVVQEPPKPVRVTKNRWSEREREDVPKGFMKGKVWVDRKEAIWTGPKEKW